MKTMTFRIRNISLVALSFSFVILLLATSCVDHKKAAKDLITEGIQELEKGNSLAAQKRFEEASEKDPKLAEAWFYKGSTLYNLDKKAFKQAISDLTMAIKLDSNYGEAYATRGQIKFYLNDKNGACEDWRKADKLGRPNMKDKTRFCP